MISKKKSSQFFSCRIFVRALVGVGEGMSSARAALLASLAREINCLRDSDRHKRRSGLDALQRELFTKVSATQLPGLPLWS
jgi:hypothetical protein